MNQLFMGALLGGLPVLGWWLRRRRASNCLLCVAPLSVAAGALWAVIPDLPRAVGWHALYRRLADDPRMDWFFWHYTIDRIESDAAWVRIVCQMGGLVVMLALLAMAWHELRRREKEASWPTPR